MSRPYLLLFSPSQSWSSPVPRCDCRPKEGTWPEERHFKVSQPVNVGEAWLLIATRVKDAERLLAEKQTNAVHEIGKSSEPPCTC